MACYIVVFEVNDATRLASLKESLKSFSGYCPLTVHSWAITTGETAVNVRDKLSACLDRGDRIYVFRSGTEGAWRNAYGEENNEWLKKNL